MSAQPNGMHRCHVYVPFLSNSPPAAKPREGCVSCVQGTMTSSGARHGDAAWRRRANPAALRLASSQVAVRLAASKRPSGLFQRRFIGTLAEGVQVGDLGGCATMTKSRINPLPTVHFGHYRAASGRAELKICGSRCSSPTFPRIPGPSCGSRPAWASKRTSSSRRASRSPTAPSAAPAWTTSIRSRSCAISSWEAFRGLAARARRPRLVLFTTRAATSYLDHAYQDDDVLLFGRESAGVPDAGA